MCGIFGVLGRSTATRAMIDAIAAANTQRGNRAFGLMSWSAGSYTVTRTLGPWSPEGVVEAPVVLGHVRAPTNGGDALQTTHPFETPEFLLAHNGIFIEPGAIAPELAFSGPPVDSMALVHGIDRALRSGVSTADAIAQTAAALDGQQACWLWHKREEALYLWRVMSTLYAGVSHAVPDRLCFSSTPTGDADTLLAEGSVFRASPDTPRLVSAATFPSYSPYLVADP